MTRILKVSQDDYKVKVRDGGTITLDTGNGAVVVIGNLNLQGTLTAIDTVNTTVKDNTIILNDGESSTAGIGGGYGSAGLVLDRGPVLPSAQFLFDETLSYYDPSSGFNTNGAFVLKTSSPGAGSSLSGLEFNTILTGDNDFIFDFHHTTSNVVRLANIAPMDYAGTLLEADSTDDIYNNALTTKKYVTEYVNRLGTTSRIYKNDINGILKTEVQAFETSVDISINQLLSARVSSTGLYVNNINMYGNTITDIDNTANLTLASRSNTIDVTAILSLQNQISSPTDTLTGVTRIFPLATIGSGRTGLYVRNAVLQDELIIKSRALAFSMLF